MILTTGENGQVDVAVAVPVTAGIGAVLQEIVIVLGQVMVTWPCNNATGARARMIANVRPSRPLLREGVWGLAPG